MTKYENKQVKPNTLTLGYELDAWKGYGAKIPVTVDLSPTTNSHMVICGISGGGKSFAEQSYIAKMKQAQPNGEFYFADYKGDDTFSYLRDCPRYYSYKQTLKALDIVYDRMNERLSGKNETRHPITLFWDEYMANILNLQGEDKDKKPAERLAPAVMNRVSEILLMGRSMSVRITIICQRPDAVAFPVGSRLNYGIVVILGAYIRSIFEMLMPDHVEQIKERQFGRGEGVALLGSELHFIKIPRARDYERMQELCVQALS
jgi:hypothetical protein